MKLRHLIFAAICGLGLLGLGILAHRIFTEKPRENIAPPTYSYGLTIALQNGGESDTLFCDDDSLSDTVDSVYLNPSDTVLSVSRSFKFKRGAIYGVVFFSDTMNTRGIIRRIKP